MGEIFSFQTSIFDGSSDSLYEKSLSLIRSFSDAALSRYSGGYLVGYSGGKDSDVLVELFKRSGVPFVVYHNHTTLDSPATVYYVRKKFAEFEASGIECHILYPRMSFWALCRQKKILPSRTMRFCCKELKENSVFGSPHAVRCFGVRRSESFRRSLRDSIELNDVKDFSRLERFHFDNSDDVLSVGACYTKNYFTLNPLAYWSDEYLRDFISSEHIEFNPMYSLGFKRVGCIGCCMTSRCEREREFSFYPRFEKLYKDLVRDIFDIRVSLSIPFTGGWKTWQEYYEWWVNG